VSSRRVFGFSKPRVRTQACPCEVRRIAPPERVRIPIALPGQPPLAPAVAVGDAVKLGQAIAATATASAVHATVAGRVANIGVMHGTDGREVHGIEIQAAGPQDWIEAKVLGILERTSWDDLTSTLVGLGAASPWKPKAMQERMGPGELRPIHTIVIVGSEREPGLAVQCHYLTEGRQDLLDSLAVIRTLAGEGARILLLVPEAMRAGLGEEFGAIEVQPVTDRYPDNHWQRLLARAAGVGHTNVARAREGGFLLMSAEEAALAGRSLREGLPRTAKLLTVAGGPLAEPVTVETVLGAPIEHVLRELGFDVQEGDRVILGGLWHGHAQFDLQAPVTRTTDGLQVLSAGDVARLEENPCINCGRCTSVCPVRIQVAVAARYAEFGLMDEAYDRGAHACIECGLCAHVCPARRPLLQYMRFAVLKHEDCLVRDSEGSGECLDCKLPTAHDLPSAPRAESWTDDRS